ncbi:MAG: signal recognition particle protein Srp19 [Candidatus Syntropharchaeia archaeon]
MKKIVIWPVNIDATKSRREGRITPKKFSVKSPKLREIQEAAKKLGLNPVLEEEKSYPKSWWERNGRVLVDKKSRKSEIAKDIASKIKEMRTR